MSNTHQSNLLVVGSKGVPLAIIENLCELDPKIGDVVYERSPFLPWLLKRLQRPEFDYNKQYASELLAVLLQNSERMPQKSIRLCACV